MTGIRRDDVKPASPGLQPAFPGLLRELHEWFEVRLPANCSTDIHLCLLSLETLQVLLFQIMCLLKLFTR